MNIMLGSSFLLPKKCFGGTCLIIIIHVWIFQKPSTPFIWQFLLKVINYFAFNSIFGIAVTYFFQYAFLSIFINSKPLETLRRRRLWMWLGRILLLPNLCWSGLGLRSLATISTKNPFYLNWKRILF